MEVKTTLTYIKTVSMSKMDKFSFLFEQLIGSVPKRKKGTGLITIFMRKGNNITIPNYIAGNSMWS